MIAGGAESHFVERNVCKYSRKLDPLRSTAPIALIHYRQIQKAIDTVERKGKGLTRVIRAPFEKLRKRPYSLLTSGL